jgi:hypothetical protein
MSEKSLIIQSAPVDFNKRQTLKWLVVSPLLLTPLNSQAGFWLFLSTHAVRFVGGLVYDAATAVLANVVRGAFSSGYGGYSSGSVSFHSALPVGETDFYHAGYKVAVSRLGLSDAEYDQSRLVKLNLKGDANLARFESLHRYLYDNDIRVVPAKGEYSRDVSLKTSPDDLFTIENFVFDGGNEALRQHHYAKMLEVTNNDVFKRWMT